MIAAYVTEHAQALVLGLVIAAVGCFVAASWMYRDYRRLLEQERAANERHRAMREEFDRRQREQQELFAQEEEWLNALLSDLRAKGVENFASTDIDEGEALDDDDEMERVLGLSSCTPTSKESGSTHARPIWRDEPQWDWPKGKDEFEFVHLPTGARGSLCRSYLPSHFPAWHVSVNLPRPESIRQIPLPRTFAKRSGPDWSGALPYSRVPSDQPERAIFEAKQWLLSALRGDIEVTQGGIVPTPLTPGDFTSTFGTKYWRNL